MDYRISQIGVIHSCYKEKFGVPRQPGLAPLAEGVIELSQEYAEAEAVRGLEQFSHIWVIFLFHQTLNSLWKPTVRPPRLGGNQRMGVFASRSPFRPNHLGLSVVALQHVEASAGRVCLHVNGLDLVDGTPVVDIKPYLPYVDAIPEAVGGYADQSPGKVLRVEFSSLAQQQCQSASEQYPQLEKLIEQVLVLDPRPAYSEGGDTERVYGMKLYEFDVKWVVRDDMVHVLSLGYPPLQAAPT